MDNQDTLFNKIKSAAENAETKDFPSMEKVWSRIDAKLDTKVQKKQNNNWKKLLVAASILVFVFVGYQFLKPDVKIENNDTNKVVHSTIEESKPEMQQTENAVAVEEVKKEEVKTYPSSVISNNADAILQSQMNEKVNEAVVVNDSISTKKDKKMKVEVHYKSNEENAALVANKSMYNTASANNGAWMVKNRYESRGVVQTQVNNEDISVEFKEAPKAEADKKLDPILVLDGKISNKSVSNLDDEEIESLILLEEPLYFINKVEYTEQELFGPNPTSPYSPLKKQNIETFTVLQPDKAISIYGKRGEKGVVIITTKDGKPKEQKKK